MLQKKPLLLVMAFFVYLKEGKLTSRGYQDKDGQKRYITEVLVNELLIQVRVLAGLLRKIGYFPGGLGEGTTLSTAFVLFK